MIYRSLMISDVERLFVYIGRLSVFFGKVSV